MFDAVIPPIAVLIVDDNGALSAAFSSAHRDGGCDGSTVAHEMRRSARFASVPVIAHTSLSEADVVKRRAGLLELIEHVAPSMTAWSLKN